MTKQELKSLYNYYVEHSLRRAGWGQRRIDDVLYARLCAALIRHWAALVHVRKHLTTPDQIRAGDIAHLTIAPELAHYRGLIARADTLN